jgi:hypothetical protein
MKRSLLFALSFLVLAACDEDPEGPDNGNGNPDPDSVLVLPILGHGEVTERYTAEVAVSGTTAYTTSWAFRQLPGNTVYIWDVSGNVPQLVDTLLVSGASTLGDVQISPDGSLLVVPTESQGSLVIYDRSDPRAPTVITRYLAPEIAAGVHTVKLGEVDGTLYAFLQIDPRLDPAQLVILDLSDPANPEHVFDEVMGSPFVHDVFVRDGLLFAAVWDEGMRIYDIGGGDLGGTPADPALIGDIALDEIHNIWWFHDPTAPENRYVFLGQEGPGSVGGSASGDIHVVDISDPSDPVYVARYRVPGAGTHNFSMDEESGILYAAYYNGGVRALDVRGDLSACADDERTAGGVCDLALMGREVGAALHEDDHYVWGVAFQDTHVYASDMLSGLYKIDVSELIR